MIPKNALEIVNRYFVEHNDGVKSGDFKNLVELFAHDCEMSFAFGSLGTLKSQDAIISAFKNAPPSDELVARSIEQSESAIVANYGWKSRKDSKGGSLTFEFEGARIKRLIIR